MEVTFPNTSDDTAADIDLENVNTNCRFPRRHSAKLKKVCAKEERNASIKRVSLILQKSEDQRTFEEAQMLRQCSEAVEEVQLRWKKRDEAKRRTEEFEEPVEVLKQKCQILAQAIAQSQHLVVYTGAGISTAARIPDYRGPNGIWTRLQQGKDIGNHDLSLAEPTYTHMALSQLYRQNILKYVVSQNCDGLHLRSGLPRNALSELHGNMYVEVCKTCKPAKEYWRLFDVTENTARYSHKTMRKCYTCHEPLVDTIVHFGERGTLQWPLNWSGASKNAQKATTILCLGSSLKVLKRYPWLWQMDKPVKKRPNLYIVNLQWTPKDDCANIKIHGRCDVVMKLVMDFLGVTVAAYDRLRDPIFHHAAPLCEEELHTTTQPILKSDSIEMEYEMEEKHENVLNEMKSEESRNSTLHSTEPQLQSVSSDCDIKCNTDHSIKGSDSSSSTYLKQNNERLHAVFNNISDNSVRQQPADSRRCNFSIDNILHGDTRVVQENVKKENDFEEICNDAEISSNFLSSGLFLPQTYHTLLAYCRFSNAVVLQNPLSYQDMMYYPYQTSLLYSGLHNIINPLPFFNSNFNNINLDQKEAKPLDNKRIEIQANVVRPEIFSCKFCNKQFKSASCLFYAKSDPVFLKPEQSVEDSAKKPVVCLCCDYSTDEDEENKKDKNCEVNTTSKPSDEKDDLSNTVKEQLKSKIQAGWFGKGYRKIKRPRKK